VDGIALKEYLGDCKAFLQNRGLPGHPSCENSRAGVRSNGIGDVVPQASIHIMIVADLTHSDARDKIVAGKLVKQFLRNAVWLRQRGWMIYFGNQKESPFFLDYSGNLREGPTDIIHVVEGIEACHKVKMLVIKWDVLGRSTNILHLMRSGA